MRYLKYHKAYGEKSFKVLLLLGRKTLQTLENLRLLYNSNTAEDNVHLLFTIYLIRKQAEPIFAIILRLEEHVLTKEEYSLFLWAHGITCHYDLEIKKVEEGPIKILVDKYINYNEDDDNENELVIKEYLEGFLSK